jgi:hypothetical protein
MGAFSGVGRAIKDEPSRLLLGVPGIMAGASKVRKREKGAEAQRRAVQAAKVAEEERKKEEARTSAIAQKERARRRTLFAGGLPEARPSLFARRLGGTRGQLAQTLGSNEQ